jgi:hypothetical protein
MTRLLLLSICFLFLVNLSYAQGNLTGRIYENKTKVPLAGINIQNLNSHFSTLSDKNGGFAIRAHIGDLITFSGFSYQPDTLYVKDLNSIEILLDLKQNMLKGVQVVTPETNTGNLTAPPTLAPFGGHTLVYQTDESGNYVGGVTLRLFDSHKGAKKKKSDAQKAKDEEANQQIDKAFSIQNLQNYLPLKGQELENFIILYRPDIDIFTSKDFNLTVYIDTCYRAFLQIPPEKRQSKEFLQLNKKAN